MEPTTVELFSGAAQQRAKDRNWVYAQGFWESANRALTNHAAAPTAVLFLDALNHNAKDVLRRSTKPVRLASKSLRSRELLWQLLQNPFSAQYEGIRSHYQGVLAYSVAEAIWLVQSNPETFTDVLVAYPTVDRRAIAALSSDAQLAKRVTLMVDSAEHLDLIVEACSGRESIRVCIDMDMSYRSRLFGHIGVRRSKLYHPHEVRTFAEQILEFSQLTLVGLMGYEAQIAGLGNDPQGQAFLAGLETRVIHQLQRASLTDLRARRTEAVGMLRELAELEFVNGGGTGSIESTILDDSVTEVAAGSGIFGSHLFDHYREFHPAPAAAFALPVVRKPDAHTATLFGGGWVASGPAGTSRNPIPVWPEGLKLLDREGVGEVQTPVTGSAAAGLSLGDWVWWRHAKAGELSEHCQEFVLILGDLVIGGLLSYRGEGKMFV